MYYISTTLLVAFNLLNLSSVQYLGIYIYVSQPGVEATFILISSLLLSCSTGLHFSGVLGCKINRKHKSDLFVAITQCHCVSKKLVTTVKIQIGSKQIHLHTHPKLVLPKRSQTKMDRLIYCLHVNLLYALIFLRFCFMLNLTFKARILHLSSMHCHMTCNKNIHCKQTFSEKT
jgi:hypothetical protein